MTMLSDREGTVKVGASVRLRPTGRSMDDQFLPRHSRSRERNSRALLDMGLSRR